MSEKEGILHSFKENVAWLSLDSKRCLQKFLQGKNEIRVLRYCCSYISPKTLWSKSNVYHFSKTSGKAWPTSSWSTFFNTNSFLFFRGQEGRGNRYILSPGLHWAQICNFFFFISIFHIHVLYVFNKKSFKSYQKSFLSIPVLQRTNKNNKARHARLNFFWLTEAHTFDLCRLLK